jgi:hypothetical protein
MRNLMEEVSLFPSTILVLFSLSLLFPVCTLYPLTLRFPHPSIPPIQHTVSEYQIGLNMAPTLRQIVEFVNDAADWLDLHPRNVCVVHCNNGKGRTGLSCALYYIALLYSAYSQFAPSQLNKLYCIKVILIACRCDGGIFTFEDWGLFYIVGGAPVVRQP